MVTDGSYTCSGYSTKHRVWNHYIVQPKLKQHCVSTIFQLKKKKELDPGNPKGTHQPFQFPVPQSNKVCFVSILDNYNLLFPCGLKSNPGPSVTSLHFCPSLSSRESWRNPGLPVLMRSFFHVSDTSRVGPGFLKHIDHWVAGISPEMVKNHSASKWEGSFTHLPGAPAPHLVHMHCQFLCRASCIHSSFPLPASLPPCFSPPPVPSRQPEWNMAP